MKNIFGMVAIFFLLVGIIYFTTKMHEHKKSERVYLAGSYALGDLVTH